VNEEEHKFVVGDDGMEEVLLQALEAHGEKYGNYDEMISSYDSRSIPKTAMDLISSTNVVVIIIISHHTTTWALTQVILQGFPVMGKNIFQLVTTNGEFLSFCTLVQFERVSLHGNVSRGAPLLKTILPAILVLIWMEFQVTCGCYDLFPAYMQVVLCHALKGSTHGNIMGPIGAQGYSHEASVWDPSSQEKSKWVPREHGSEHLGQPLALRECMKDVLILGEGCQNE
ncbi:hypothetical protein KI387_042102, partial [Taxus chinensis]